MITHTFLTFLSQQFTNISTNKRVIYMKQNKSGPLYFSTSILLIICKNLNFLKTPLNLTQYFLYCPSHFYYINNVLLNTSKGDN